MCPLSGFIFATAVQSVLEQNNLGAHGNDTGYQVSGALVEYNFASSCANCLPMFLFPTPTLIDSKRLSLSAVLAHLM